MDCFFSLLQFNDFYFARGTTQKQFISSSQVIIQIQYRIKQVQGGPTLVAEGHCPAFFPTILSYPLLISWIRYVQRIKSCYSRDGWKTIRTRQGSHKCLKSPVELHCLHRQTDTCFQDFWIYVLKEQFDILVGFLICFCLGVSKKAKLLPHLCISEGGEARQLA